MHKRQIKINKIEKEVPTCGSHAPSMETESTKYFSNQQSVDQVIMVFVELSDRRKAADFFFINLHSLTQLRSPQHSNLSIFSMVGFQFVAINSNGKPRKSRRGFPPSSVETTETSEASKHEDSART